MRPIALIAIAVLALGGGHLFIVTRALLDPAWLHTIVVEAAADVGGPIAEWEEALVYVLTTFSVVGILAVSSGIGLLRRQRLARLAWITASAVLVVVYGVAFVIYALSGVAWCASLAGIVTVIALVSLIYLPKQQVQRAFTGG